MHTTQRSLGCILGRRELCSLYHPRSETVQRLRSHHNQIPGSGPLEKRSVLPLSDSFSFLRSLQRHLLSRSCLPFARSFCTSVPQHALIRSSPVISRSSGAGFHTFPKAALYLLVLHSLMNAAGCGTCSVSGGGKTLDMAMSTIP